MKSTARVLPTFRMATFNRWFGFWNPTYRGGIFRSL
jgi:hypothetical protein